MDMTFLVGLMVGLFPVIALAQVIAARLHIPFALILTGTRAIIGLGITALADGKLVFRTRHDGRGCETALQTGRCNPCVRRSSAVAGFALHGPFSQKGIAGTTLMVWAFCGVGYSQKEKRT